MKKKLYAIYALVGALAASPVFTSCVDDTESQSVTELRGAKAEQLKSIAAMNNAEAQAKLIYANAEAALKAAQAAQEQALADKAAAEAAYQEALTKAQELENQLKEAAYDAELAAALAQAQAALAEAEKAKLEAEKEIEKINGEALKYQLKLEAKIAELQAELIEKKQALIDAENDATEAEIERLEALATAYSNALTAYTETQNALANLKTEKLALEADLVDLNTAKEKQIAKNEASIEVIDQQIAYLKEYENYSDDVETLKNELTLKEAERSKANDVVGATQEKYNAAINALANNEELTAAMEAINENELIKMYYNQWSDDYKYDGRWYSYEDPDGDGWYDLVEYGTYIDFTPYNPITNIYTAYCNIEKEKYQTISHDSLVVEIEAQDLRRLALAIDDAIEELDITAMTESVNAETTGLKAVYEAKVAATATAKAAYEAKKTDAALKTAYETALGEEESAEWAYKQTLEAIENAEESKAKLEELYALVSTDTAELEEAVDAYNEAIHTEWLAIAEIEYSIEDAQKVVNDLDAEITAMNATIYGKIDSYVSLYDYLYSEYVGRMEFEQDSYNWIEYINDYGQLNFGVGGSGYNYMYGYNYTWSSSREFYLDFYTTYIIQSSNSNVDGAATIQGYIEDLETQKENLLEENEDVSAITSKEQAIALKDAEIAGKEATIAVLEVKMDAAKAALDAAIPAEGAE